jgi:thiol-disulfide isomerase/thioredoxin
MVKKYLFLLLIIVLVYSVLLIFNKPVGMLFFYNKKCQVSNSAEQVLNKVEQKFQGKVNITRIEISMYQGDPPDINETKMLREQYSVNGAPTLIINGVEYPSVYESSRISLAICSHFVVWPKECFIFWK